jgi:CheY-like chemotaxis protein
LVENEAFDVLLMDVQMPIMDRLEATKAIRGLGSLSAALPILAMTASAMPED